MSVVARAGPTHAGPKGEDLFGEKKKLNFAYEGSLQIKDKYVYLNVSLWRIGLRKGSDKKQETLKTRSKTKTKT